MTTTLTTPGTVRRATELTEALSDFIRVIQFRDRDRACCHGLSVTQCYALKAVCDGAALGVNDLAARLYLDKSTASRIVDGLVEAGMIRKERDPDDGRARILMPTPEGLSTHRVIQRELVQEHAELLDGLDEDGQKAVLRTIRKLASGFGEKVEASGGSCCVVR